MDIVEIIALAIIQGVLEFIPISSSGHVLIFSQLLGWEDPGFVFDAIIHLGSLLAILFYFRNSLFGIRPSNNWEVKFDEADKSPLPRIVILLFVATVPIGVAGFVLLLTTDALDSFFRTTQGVGISLIFTGIVLLGTSHIKRHIHNLNTITTRHVFLVGLAQALAVIPGISRSGMTISLGVYLNFKYLTATRFAFMLAIPALIGTGVVVLARGINESDNIDGTLLILGFCISAVTAFISIHLVTFVLRRASLTPFSIYALVSGTVILFSHYIAPDLFGG